MEETPGLARPAERASTLLGVSLPMANDGTIVGEFEAQSWERPLEAPAGLVSRAQRRRVR